MVFKEMCSSDGQRDMPQSVCGLSDSLKCTPVSSCRVP